MRHEWGLAASPLARRILVVAGGGNYSSFILQFGRITLLPKTPPRRRAT